MEETTLGYTFFWKGLPPGSRRIHGVGFAVKTILMRSFSEQPVGLTERIMSWRIPLGEIKVRHSFRCLCPYSSVSCS